jgi:hypothetical protein
MGHGEGSETSEMGILRRQQTADKGEERDILSVKSFLLAASWPLPADKTG